MTKNTTFLQFFLLSDKEIKEKIMSIVNGRLDHNYKGMLENCKIVRTIVNEKKTKISIEWYDTIEISNTGIIFKYENTGQTENLVNFDKTFKL